MSSILCFLVGITVLQCSHAQILEPNVFDEVDPDAFSSVKTSSTGKCDVLLFTHCDVEFYENLGFTLPTKPKDLVDQLDHLFLTQHVMGLEKLCNATRQFTNCLGGEEAARKCINVETFVKMGVKPVDALIYVILARQFHFFCSDGYFLYHSNFDCIRSVHRRQSLELAECAKHIRMMFVDSNHACMHGYKYSKCTSDLFGNHCAAVTKGFVCQTTAIPVETIRPDCKIICDANGPRPQGDPLRLAPYAGTFVDFGVDWTPGIQPDLLAEIYGKQFADFVRSHIDVFGGIPVMQVLAVSPIDINGQMKVQVRLLVDMPVGADYPPPPSERLAETLRFWTNRAGHMWKLWQLENLAYPELEHGPIVPTPPPVSHSAGWQEVAMYLEKSIDWSADPCQDFYQFACGGWQRDPAHQPRPGGSISTATYLVIDLVRNVQASLMNVTENDPRPVRQAKMAYEACINANSSGIFMGQQVLEMTTAFGGWPLIDKNFTATDSSFLIGHFSGNHGVDTFFGTGVMQDWMDPTKMIMYMDQADLYLGSRRMYLDPELMPMFLPAYKALITRVAVTLAKVAETMPNMAQIANGVNSIVQLETVLANMSTANEMRRNSSRFYNLFDMQMAQQRWPFLQWGAFLGSLGGANLPHGYLLNQTFMVTELGYMDQLNAQFANISPATMQSYLLWRIIGTSTHLKFLPMFREHFEQYQRDTDQVDMLPSSGLSCAYMVINNLAYPTGRLYIDNHFNKLPFHPRMLLRFMVGYVVGEFEEMVRGLTWMDDMSKQGAFDKIHNLWKNYAYPDWMMNDEMLEKMHPEARLNLTSDDNLLQVNDKLDRFNIWWQWHRLTMPADRTIFGGTPAQLNAWYSSTRNSITFAAGMLNYPFFNTRWPMAANFGGLGVVMGHETTHGFDDGGVQFDSTGRLHDWMDEQSQAGFRSMADCVVNEYSQFCYANMTPSCINGAQTQGENIADGGGVNAAFRAYHAYTMLGGAEPRLPGNMSRFSMEQVFFLNYGQLWCANRSKGSIMSQLLLDVHSPGRYRILGSLKNSRDFAREFNCPVGSPMNPANKCNVWV